MIGPNRSGILCPPDVWTSRLSTLLAIMAKTFKSAVGPSSVGPTFSAPLWRAVPSGTFKQSSGPVPGPSSSRYTCCIPRHRELLSAVRSRRAQPGVETTPVCFGTRQVSKQHLALGTTSSKQRRGTSPFEDRRNNGPLSHSSQSSKQRLATGHATRCRNNTWRLIVVDRCRNNTGLSGNRRGVGTTPLLQYSLGVETTPSSPEQPSEQRLSCRARCTSAWNNAGRYLVITTFLRRLFQTGRGHPASSLGAGTSVPFNNRQDRNRSFLHARQALLEPGCAAAYAADK